MQAVSAIPGYYTVEEAAAVIGVSHSQVTRYIADGKLEAKPVGQQYLIEQLAAHNFVRPPRGNPLFRKPRRRTASSR